MLWSFAAGASTDLRVSARRGGGNPGSIAAGEVEWAGRRAVLDARWLEAVARARRRCLRALLAFFLGVRLAHHGLRRLDVNGISATSQSRACAQKHEAVGSKLGHRRPRAGAYFVRR